jgi:hypothetical protein
MAPDFFAIGREYREVLEAQPLATPEKKPRPPESDTDTPEKLPMSSDHGSDSDSDSLDTESLPTLLSDLEGSESSDCESTADEEDQPSKKKNKKKKKKKKKHQKKKHRKQKKTVRGNKSKKHKKSIPRNWYQGRDKMRDDLPQDEKNRILQASFEKHIASWKKACPLLEDISETTQEVAGVIIFQLGCKSCMAYVV